MYQLRLFFVALQFFTRLPVPTWVGYDEGWLRRCARYFPLVGLLVGAVSAMVVWLAGMVLPPVLAILLSLVASLMTTGALHEDGFADMCDGFGGGRDPTQVLAIMKDSRIGVYGAIGIGLLLAVKCAALAYLPQQTLPIALLTAHPLSRAFSTTLIWRFNYVRVDGKSASVAHRLRAGEFFFAALCGLLPLACVVFAGLLALPQALAGLLIAACCTAYLARMCLRRIAGYTGDCLGAVQQLSEAGFYLGIVSSLFYISRTHY
ncbi:MAG TPA: adenosylcobinamide-GDP ribazoletransferase [Burkholderiaceae bacterium]|jgi:adenosylcobinamide-GDP ribazoletransferase